MLDIRSHLTGSHSWLVTGAAGFIGSNLVEALLRADQHVVGLDNFATGHRRNLEEVQREVGAKAWARFRLVEGDIQSIGTCKDACQDAHFVLHHAALGSVPNSLQDPISFHCTNVSGFLNMLIAARDAGVRRFVYASSSAVYGDSCAVPANETSIGQPLSPYGAGKQMNEIYAATIARCYGMPTIGLRYFNVFGPRQDPNGAYAAVIPKWISSLILGEPVYVNGDGETTRDFCHVDNVVHANIICALTEREQALNQIFNIALGNQLTLNELYLILARLVTQRTSSLSQSKPIYRDFRPGDIRTSQADISKARALLGYNPRLGTKEGLEQALDWYLTSLKCK